MRKFKNLSKKSRIIIITSLVLAVCLILAAGIYFIGISMLFGRHYEPNLIISSPDGQYELVIREYSCLGGVGADIYIRGAEWYNIWNKKKIGHASGDDYYQPFSNGTYYVEWKSDKVTIFYYMGLGPWVENANDRSTWRGVLSYDLD
jgi:hypothetical protein